MNFARSRLVPVYGEKSDLVNRGGWFGKVFATPAVRIGAMSSHFMKYTVPSILAAGLAALAISACGGSDDPAVSDLAKFVPSDTPVYVEGAVQPEADVAENADAITEELVGSSLGGLLKEMIASSGEVDFEADIEPWLGENAAFFVDFDPNALTDRLSADIGEAAAGFDDLSQGSSEGGESFGLVIETTDVDAAESYIDKSAREDGGNPTEGEYEGYRYVVSDGDATGIVDDHMLVSDSEAGFKAMVDASKGNSLSDDEALSAVADKVDGSSLVNVYVANEPLFASSGQADDVDFDGLLSALGINYENTGSMFSLVPEENEISLRAATNLSTDLRSGNITSVIENAPADTVFVTGAGNVGANAKTIIDALNEEGIPGILEPGEVDEMLNEISGNGVDVPAMIESLETISLFVNGSNPRNLGGALVGTSSDIDAIENSLRGFSSLIALADDAQVRPLPGDAVGFMVRTPELPGRPIVIGVKDDRMVIGVGNRSSMAALNGGGETLADDPAYQAAVESVSGENLTSFGNPGRIAGLIDAFAGPASRDAAQISEVLRKFEYMVTSSSDDETEGMLNLGLRE